MRAQWEGRTQLQVQSKFDLGVGLTILNWIEQSRYILIKQLF